MAAKGSSRARGSSGARKPPSRKRSTPSGAKAGEQPTPADLSGKSAAELRDALTRGVIAPLDLVMLTRERIEETMSDAVARGRMTAEDARQLAQGLIERGQQQTSDVLRDLEQLLGRGRSEIEERADRARRAAGVGSNFPIRGYDALTVAQVQSRLGGLSPAELRRVRDYERRNANRKSVLNAVEAKLG